MDPYVINSGWGEWFETAMKLGLEANSNHAAFITACEYHCSLWSTSKIGGLTPAAAFELWDTRGASALPNRLLDDGGVFPCPECCATGVCAAGPASAARVSLVPETAAPQQGDAVSAVCHNAYTEGLHEIVLPSGRKFLLAVPKKLPAAPAQAPVIFDWHGYTESPHYQNKLTGMATTADRYGWLAVLPFGTSPIPTATCCPADCDEECCQSGHRLDQANACSWNSGVGGCCGAAVASDVDDVAFARSIVDWLKANMSICMDDENIFTTGFSNGAMFSNRLGCEAADLFKGIAPVEGNLQTGEFGDDYSRCQPSESVAWLSFCGTADGACHRAGATDFQDQAEFWAAVNSCDPTGHETFSSATTTCMAWNDCSGSPAQFVERCWVEGLTHEWSGHTRPNIPSFSPPRTAADLDATEYIFSRFSALTQRARSVRRLGGASMQLIGHRGASAVAPENTAAAYNTALARGADGVECDLHLLADGTIVVLHDDSLRRTGTLPAATTAAEAARLLDVDVSTLSWDDVSSIDIGSSKGPEFSRERLLQFPEFLAVVGSHGTRTAFVELKGGDMGMIEPAASAAQAAFAAGTLEERLLTWISFDIDLMGAMKLRLPNSPAYLVAAVSPTDPDPEARCRELIDAAVAFNLDGIDLAAVESVVTAAVVSYAKRRGLVVGVWVTGSLDVESGWRVFAGLGVDYLTTNMPPEIYEVFERRPQR